MMKLMNEAMIAIGNSPLWLILIAHIVGLSNAELGWWSVPIMGLLGWFAPDYRKR